MPREPYVCEICGADVSGANPFFTVEFAEFGRARADGKFCSLAHATEWAKNPPALIPMKHPFDPSAPGTAPKGLLVLAVVLFVLVCFVAGLVTLARALIGSL